MTPPRISVVLPVYNSGPYLSEAIQSILDQTFQDFEILAIDDGSTDGSLAKLQRLANLDSRIRVITRPNRGITPTLNEGIAQARGTLIARMDGDDIAHPDRFQKQVAYLDAHPDVVALGGQFVLIDPKGRRLKVFEMPTTHAEIDAQHMTANHMAMCHPAVMMRSAALARVGGYNEGLSVAQDIDLWLRLAEIGKLANLDDVILEYRQHLDSIGYGKRHQQRMVAWQAVVDAARRRGCKTDVPRPPLIPEAPRDEVFRKWGWWALNGGNADTARVYATKALLRKPTERENWRLLACAIRGR